MNCARASLRIAMLYVAGFGILDCHSLPVLADSATAVLGEAPVCEPSALVRAPWNPDIYLVADNEVQGALYGYILEGNSFRGQAVLEMPPKNRPRDIEALAAVDGRLLVVGSFSRNSSCKPKAKRRRLRALSWSGSELENARYLETSKEQWTEIVRSAAVCESALFTEPDLFGAKELCEALVSGENSASAENCTVFNIEGAAAVPPASSGEVSRVWLGLRSPLVEKRAALIRLTPGLNEFRFDAIRLIDLNDRGIRSLSHDGDRLWGIAGPTQDEEAPFLLWSLDATRLGTNEVPAPVFHRDDLPTSAEGLLIDGGVVRGVIDGRGPDDKNARPPQNCREPAGQFHLPIEPND